MSLPFGLVRERKRPLPPMPPTTFEAAAAAPPPGGVTLQLEHVRLSSISHANRALRRRAKRDIDKNAATIEATGFHPPIVIDRTSGRVLQGEGHLETYRLLKRETVPVLYVDGLTPTLVDAIQLWLPAFEAASEWDALAVKDQLEQILAENPDNLAHVFLDMSEIDFFLLTKGAEAGGGAGKVEAVAPAPVARPGDLFVWSSGHRALCGNSRLPETYATLMAGQTAKLLASDPPFGTAVASISGHHKEWLEGSGMSEAETTAFLTEFLQASVVHLANGALAYCFIDSKGMFSLQSAIRAAGLAQKQICTWDKGSGVGGFYMNVAEYVVIAKHGRGKHVFNTKAGFNTTVWSLPGYASFRPDRAEALADHACTKPQGVLMPILLAASKVHDIVLDPFLGSGSMMLAAERTKRRCYGVELDPTFVDTTVRRMRQLTGAYPIHEQSGLVFNELAAERGVPLPVAPLAGDDEL